MTTRTGTATLFPWFRSIAHVREAILSKVTFWRFCTDLKRTVLTSSENVVIICAKMAAFSTVYLEVISYSLKKAAAVEQKTAKG